MKTDVNWNKICMALFVMFCPRNPALLTIARLSLVNGALIRNIHYTTWDIWRFILQVNK